MSQCQATTKKKKRCLNNAVSGGRFCQLHQDTVDGTSLRKAATVVIGTIAGHAIFPGVGTIVGLAVAALVAEEDDGSKGMKTSVFISFDFENDKKLKDFIIGQSKRTDSPFSVVDQSLKEAVPERDWEKKADAAIARSSVVLVMVGPQTYKASGVLKEVKMARSRNKKIVQVIGYKDGNYTRVPDAGQLYTWNWENLKKLLG